MSRFKPSPALVVSAIALFMALGGTSYAAFTVGTSQIKSGAVTTKKLHNGAVTQAKLAGGLTVANANHANTANSATTANSANNANHANNADSATNATTATNANQLGGVAPSGYEKAIAWVHVAADGTILAQSGGISVVHGGTGYYFINFGFDTTGHALLVSPSGKTFSANEMWATSCGGGTQGVNCVSTNDVNHVVVDSQAPAGTYADHAYFLAVVP